jgi:hypothetical protein
VEQVRKAVSFFQKLANYRKLRWASEVKAPNCSDEMRTSNACLTQNEDSVTALLQKLLNYLTLLFGTGTPETAPSKSNSLFFIAKLNSTTTALRDAWKERSSHMSGKISLEQLQDPFISPELKAVNEKLIISLSSAVSMIGMICTLNFAVDTVAPFLTTCMQCLQTSLGAYLVSSLRWCRTQYDMLSEEQSQTIHRVSTRLRHFIVRLDHM